MIITGVDIIEVQRVKRIIARWGPRFLDRIFTKGELAYCKNRVSSLAVRFAAKEATMKALGTGVKGVGWQDIEVTRAPGEPPRVSLHGRASKHAKSIGLQELALSLSHSNDYAIASVTGVCTDPP